MADNIPNFLGNSVNTSELVVNLDGDIGVGASIESAGKGIRLENVSQDVDGGAGGDEVSCSGGELGLVPFLDPVNTIGPVQDTGSKLGGVVGKKGGRVKKSGDVIGPKFLQTRRGDVCVEGPSVSKGVEERCVVVTHVSDDETHVAPKEVMVERQRVMSSRSCVNKKALCKRPLPELPPKKMRYFSAPPQPRNRPSRRKKTEQRVNPGAAMVESDSIHNSDLTPENHEIVATNEEFLLEVVLPCLPADVATSNSFSPLANQEESGVMCLLNNADAVSGRANDIALEPPSRQIMEAKKISDIQQQVGICVLGSQEEHLKRIGDLEVRDQVEKEGWEVNRETGGFQ
ncbi:hypothetical protein P8452_51411 [Trifolium repens]|nr:hypothetical protein P8452_51411 [Trifolium repens]